MSKAILSQYIKRVDKRTDKQTDRQTGKQRETVIYIRLLHFKCRSLIKTMTQTRPKADSTVDLG